MLDIFQIEICLILVDITKKKIKLNKNKRMIEISKKKTDSFCVLHIFKVYTGCMNQSANPQKMFCAIKKKAWNKNGLYLIFIYIYMLYFTVLLFKQSKVSLFFRPTSLLFSTNKEHGLLLFFIKSMNVFKSHLLLCNFIKHTKKNSITKGSLKRGSQLVSKYSLVLNW